MSEKKFSNSLKWWDKVQNKIPAGCSTLAKTPERLFPGYTPICCEKSKGSKFEDIDGNMWIDCEMGMGTVIWGHSRDEINNAVIEQLFKGTSYSIPAKIEYDLAELLLSRFEYYDSVRFCKNGVDAVSAAVRLIRAQTGRSIIVSGTYHGWHDWCAYGYYGREYKKLGIPKGVADTTRWLCNNTYEDFLNIANDMYNDLCGIVLCPAEWKQEELKKVWLYCKEKSIPVIFDEVTSGMRMGKKATAGEYNIWPDILCISKGLANGLPLAAILSSNKYMKYMKQIKFTNAHSSECVALAAAIASEKLLQKQDIWPSWKLKSQNMIDEILKYMQNTNIKSSLELKGYYGCFCIASDSNNNFIEDPFREHFVKYLASKGIFSKGYIILCDQHSDDEIGLIKESIIEAMEIWEKSK